MSHDANKAHDSAELYITEVSQSKLVCILILNQYTYGIEAQQLTCTESD